MKHGNAGDSGEVPMNRTSKTVHARARHGAVTLGNAVEC